MRKNILLIITLLGLVLFLIPTAEAHELKSSGTINALLHINPDDDPVAGQTSELLFLIDDTDKKFTAENCNCQASVSYNNAALLSSPLFRANSSYRGIFAPAIAFTFPHKGIYTIKLAGTPKNDDEFQSFSVVYNIRVDKDGNTPKKSFFSTFVGYAITVLILAGITYLLKLFFIKKNYINNI